MNEYRTKTKRTRHNRLSPIRRMRAMLRHSGMPDDLGSGLRSLLGYEALTRNLPFLVFLTGMAIVYIANRHTAERNVRRMDRVEKELIELEWYYETSKDDLARRSRQSEVARLVAGQGMVELTDPPLVIEVAERGD